MKLKLRRQRVGHAKAKRLLMAGTHSVWAVGTYLDGNEFPQYVRLDEDGDLVYEVNGRMISIGKRQIHAAPICEDIYRRPPCDVGDRPWPRYR